MIGITLGLILMAAGSYRFYTAQTDLMRDNAASATLIGLVIIVGSLFSIVFMGDEW